MKILSMTATFGRLERETLRLEEGLNILHLPNEGGKSTWCAFLLAMFYGIDTSERVSKGSLPMKTKYKPWSGAAMEGRMEILWQGRRITVERKSRGRIPMGEFSAYESESGLPVRELTAENCGIVLLGAPKAVFERSAWLRESALPIGQHSALEQRLAALVTAGEEAVSYSETEKRLRDRKNALRHHKTGELPRLEQELAQTEETLRQLCTLREAVREKQAEEEAQLARRMRLERTERQLLQKEEEESRRRQLLAEEVQKEKEEALRKAREQTAALPEEAVLRQKQEEWAQLQQVRRALPPEETEAPRLPRLPEMLAGKTEEECRLLLGQTLRDYDAYARAARPEKQLGYWPAVIALAVTVLLVILKLWPFAAGMAVITAALFVILTRNAAAAERERKAAQRAAEELLRRWNAADREALQQLSDRIGAVLAAYERESLQYLQTRQQRLQRLESLRRREEDFLRELRQLLPNAEKEPMLAIGEALEQRRMLRALEQEAASAARYAALAAAGNVRSAETAEAFRNLNEQKLVVEEVLRQIRSRLNHDHGRLAAFGEPAALEAERERIMRQIAEKQEQYEAVSLAMEVLERANGVLQTQYAPEISRRAASIMSRMTGGRYDRVLLDASLHASLRQTGAVVSRGAEELSRGTADQLYLAVRLAICQMALPQDTPLILDDALVSFDDRRAAEAVALLREEANGRQILLFTCQSREKTF
ncbi:MAG: AAA family ATPase [Oscillospiraceae bacterium]|nr:AAA family ATPase [Oscillospiraceae bacterium]